MRSLPRYTWLLIVLCTLCIVFAGCRPRGVLSSQEMRSVLRDLHHTEAVLQTAGYNYGHDEAVAKYYQAIMDKHGITQAQFDSSIVWYTDHPQLFDKIYPRVVKDLKAERDAWNAQHELAQTRQNTLPQDLPADDMPRKELEDLLYELHHGVRVLYWYDETTPIAVKEGEYPLQIADEAPRQSKIPQ